MKRHSGEIKCLGQKQKCFFAANMTSTLKCERAVAYFPAWRRQKEYNKNKFGRTIKLCCKKLQNWTDVHFEERYKLIQPSLTVVRTLILDLKGVLPLLLSHCKQAEKCPLHASGLQHGAVAEN